MALRPRKPRDLSLQGKSDPYTAALPPRAGGVAERSKAAVLKTAVRKHRGFESLLLLRRVLTTE
jgi:hypothetical protein